MLNTAIKAKIQLMPKIDLHLHLDGSLKPETIIDLAREQGLELPAVDTEQLLPYMRVGEECNSLTEYLSKFDFTTRFLQTPGALERAAFEVVQQSAAHGCRYVEVRFAPQLHRGKGLSPEEAIYWVIVGLRRGERKFGIMARAIAICMRNHHQALNLEVIEAASRYMGRGIVAVDLAGDEASYPPEFFREVFALSHKKGIPVTIHAGEAAGAANINEAVTKLGATRVGHAVRLKESPEVLKMMVERGIPLEMCPVSNIQTKAVTGWDSYPIREYYEQGLNVTVNTDNPSVSGTDLTREYLILAERFDFSIKELSDLVLNSAEAAFLGDTEKRWLKRDLSSRFEELELAI
ncbi:MAG: adenosine deaminase [Gorillibacterium sp.]|nr:adenosine deaminase [Gorillibacterium sp.]